MHDLLSQQVPVLQSTSDRNAQAWIDEIKALLLRNLEKLEQEQAATAKCADLSRVLRETWAWLCLLEY